ncbi:class I SAM-dependent methyltransferase [Vibrio sp. S4M6]|uniref:class I SAM-dependent methyltransferase n=1 Tax=Vibrio sinus TaxID=2946865 RepID=UPI002029D666|nr:class I SAM-dependent methyltransferase [Vibrio sinus]MCL9781606.1 class I SAM-dependent methyltransferase [Vibrio sinus]
MTKEIEHIKALLNTHSDSNSKLQYLKDELSHEEFINIQKVFFDEESHWYASKESRPNFTEPRLQKIVSSPKSHIAKSPYATYNILDVGTGTGVLIKYIECLFSNVCIHALDLSSNQLEHVKLQYPDVEVYLGDISSFINPVEYDLIYCNACFGNILNQSSALKNMSNMLSGSGLIVISHPLGSAFVENLKNTNNIIVPNTLPKSIKQVSELIVDTNLSLVELIDNQGLYICILKNNG